MTDTTVSAKVGGNVRAELARAGKTQTWLAGLLGISQQSVSARLRGEVAFDVDELHRVARALDLELATLLGDPRHSTTP